MPARTAAPAGISSQATSTESPKAGCRAPPARKSTAAGKSTRSRPGEGARPLAPAETAERLSSESPASQMRCHPPLEGPLEAGQHPFRIVMAGLDSAIHVLEIERKAWMPESSPGMTSLWDDSSRAENPRFESRPCRAELAARSLLVAEFAAAEVCAPERGAGRAACLVGCAPSPQEGEGWGRGPQLVRVGV